MAQRLPFTSALVTGASSGIGASMARQLAEAGVPVVVVARREDRLRELAAAHAGVEVLVADLDTPDGVAAVVARLRDGDRPLDLVVNNAGFGTSGPFADLDPDRLAAEVALNVQALTRLSHAALGVMQARRRGFLLNVSSVAGFQPAPQLAVYAATKAYVTSLTESLHEEVRGTGVRVSALCPGLTRTEFQQVSSAGERQERFPELLWTDVDAVARAGLEGVAAGRALIVPGRIYQGLVAVSGVTPRWVARRLSSILRR